MVVGEVAERTDVAIIGAGPGGYTAALRCAALGKSVVLIERQAVGGTCLNVGCIPSKVLIHAADTAHLAHRSAAWGVHLEATIDAHQIQVHSASVVQTLTNGVAGLLANAGVTVWAGEAHFARPNRLAVTIGDQVKHLEFTDVVIATGSAPIEVPGLAFDHEFVLDSTDAVRLARVPAHLVVVGGGYIGVELGTAWAKLGAKVTIVESAERLLPAMDKRLAQVVQRRLASLDVDVLTRTMAVSASNGAITTRPVTGGDEVSIVCDAVLVAVGRRPQLDGLGIDRLAVTQAASGHLVVDAQRRAGAHVFAIGDVVAGPALAHKATAEAIVVADTIAGNAASFDPAAIPEVVFSDPELISVGVRADHAAETGYEVTSFRFPFAAGSRSRTIDDTAGFVQLIADTHGTIVGAQAAGAGVSELAGELSLAIEMAATIDDLALTIHPHPTMSEAIGEAAMGLAGRPLHVHR